VELLHRGDEQPVAPRRQLARVLHELRAVHLGHAVVGPNDDELLTAAQHLHRVGGLLRRHDLESLELECPLERAQHEWFVVDEQEAIHDTTRIRIA
jgi:hypothetical protein